FVDVKLGDGEPVRVFVRGLVEQRRDHLAGAAPFGPEIHEYRLVGFQDVGFETPVRHVNDFAAHRVATSTMVTGMSQGIESGEPPRPLPRGRRPARKTDEPAWAIRHYRGFSRRLLRNSSVEFVDCELGRCD